MLPAGNKIMIKEARYLCAKRAISGRGGKTRAVIEQPNEYFSFPMDYD